MGYREIAGAVLAGGRSSRIGAKSKPFITIGGVPIIQRTMSIFEELFNEIIIVTNSPGEYSSYMDRCLIVTDIIKGIGPLGGIHSGLTHTSKEAVFFVACDMPCLHNDIIQRQVAFFREIDCDVLVPKVGTLIEPLHGVYKKGLKDNLYFFIRVSNDYSVRSFLQMVNVHYWGLEDTTFHRDIFRNVNTLEDIGSLQ